MTDEYIEETNKPEKVKKNLERLFIVMGIFLIIIGAIVCIYLWRTEPEFPLKKIIIWGLFFIIPALSLIFGFKFFLKIKHNKEKKESKKEYVPEPITRDELLEITESSLTNQNYMNHVKNIINDYFVTVGEKGLSNKVFVAEVTPLFPTNTPDIYFIIINAHYPDKYMSILKNPKINKINSTINAVGGNPIEKIDFKEIVTENPTLGIKTTVKETKHHQKNKQTEENKKEAEIV